MNKYLCILKALGNNNRLNIIHLLNQNEKLGVLEISKKLNLEQTRISHYLKCLRTCGILKVKEKGKYRLYFLNKEFTTEIFKVLDRHLKSYKKEISNCEIIKNEK